MLTLTLIGFALIFLATTAGSAMVYLFRHDIPKRTNAIILGFAAGVMIAASVWSLLIPSIDAAEPSFGAWAWVPAAVGFLLGGLFLVLLDHVLPHFHAGTRHEEVPHMKVHKSTRLFLAVTIHNIPEGLAVGLAFGAASVSGDPGAMYAALGLAIGMAIQNFPEGAAIALPMKVATRSKHKAFLFGMGSGAVEPIAAVVGYVLASEVAVMHPWMLGFAAGAMIFVVAEDLIPDSNISEYPHAGTWGVMLGFVIMMVLDVALG
jgi:ZIP family zinc transporter